MVKEYHTLRIWHKGIPVIFEKNPRVKEFDNLRAIILIEADFNSLNKLLIGVNVGRATEKSGLTPPQQYSVCKVYSAI